MPARWSGWSQYRVLLRTANRVSGVWYKFEVLLAGVGAGRGSTVSSPGCRGAWPNCKAIYRAVLRQGPGCRSRVRTPMTPVGMAWLLEVWTRHADAHSAGAAPGPVVANRGYTPGCNYKASSSDRACSAVTRPYKALKREGLCGHRLCLSAPLLQCTKSFWEARMMLPGPSRGRLATAVQPTCANVPFRFRLCIVSVGVPDSPGGRANILGLLETCS